MKVAVPTGEALAATGCALGQSYHFGRPMPEAGALAAAAWIAEDWIAEDWRAGLPRGADQDRPRVHART